MVSKKVQESRHQLYIVTCVVLLVLVIAIFIMNLLNFLKDPPVIVEYRNQSCELVDTGWTDYYEPVNNKSSENITVNLDNLWGDRFGYDKVPDNYTLVEVYREDCYEGMGCKYFKQNLYFKDEFIEDIKNRNI